MTKKIKVLMSSLGLAASAGGLATGLVVGLTNNGSSPGHEAEKTVETTATAAASEQAKDVVVTSPIKLVAGVTNAYYFYNDEAPPAGAAGYQG